MGKLDGKVAVITAGTSGMALATAKLFVAEGAYVFVTGRDQTRLDEAVKEVGHNVTGIQGDSAKLDDLDRLYERVKQDKGHIDVLFASAGQSGRSAIGSVTEEEFDRIFNLNVRGTLFTVQKALPLFRDGGSIVLNGSIANQKGMPGLSVYGGSKAALRAFARSWLLDLKERRIRVNVLSPGPIGTPAMQKAPEGTRAQFKSVIPWGEFGTSQEIATAALFLACDDSKFVNGTELCVDGGVAQI
jgi:NAD(P)-dependent dehydrogenase (short-subunit alcohol dehydrogenase family)